MFARWKMLWTVDADTGGKKIEELVSYLTKQRDDLIVLNEGLMKKFQLSAEGQERVQTSTSKELETIDEWLEQLAHATLHQFERDMYINVTQQLEQLEIECSNDQVALNRFMAANQENAETRQHQRDVRSAMRGKDHHHSPLLPTVDNNIRIDHKKKRKKTKNSPSLTRAQPSV